MHAFLWWPWYVSTNIRGLSSGGLGYTHTDDKAVIGALSREFYHRVCKRCQDEDAWVWQ